MTSTQDHQVRSGRCHGATYRYSAMYTKNAAALSARVLASDPRPIRIDVDASFGAYPVTSSWSSHLSAASSMPMKRRKNGTAQVTGFAHGLSTSRIVASPTSGQLYNWRVTYLTFGVRTRRPCPAPPG